MVGKSFMGWLLLATLLSCSILSDDNLDKLPDNFRVRRIEIEYHDGSDWVTIGYPISNTANKSELNLGNGADFHFLDKKLTKIIYNLNSSGYAEKITSVFADGSEIIDDLKYNTNHQVVELSNSFFKDNYKFFYKNNKLDSIAKTRTLPNNNKQVGFIKVVNDEKMIGIFPLDNSKSYSMNFLYGGACSSGSIPSNSNEYNKVEYVRSKLIDDYYHSDNLSITYQQILNNQICQSYLSKTQDLYKNYFGNYNYSRIGTSNNCSLCGTSSNGYLNLYLLLPGIVPDSGVLFQITADSELKWINSNPKVFFADWTQFIINYKYEPSKK